MRAQLANSKIAGGETQAFPKGPIQVTASGAGSAASAIFLASAK
jgi:hypothetical protein